MSRKLRVSSALAFLLGLPSVALGQANLPNQTPISSIGSDVTFGPTYLATSAPAGQRTGLSLSETALLHVGLGAEAGYDSNVFYQNASVVSSPLLRVTPFLQITNTNRSGVAPPGVSYNLGAALLYREYLTDDPNVKAQRAFNPSASGNVEFSSGRTLGLIISDTFTRVEDPPYAPSQGSIIRDSNYASAALRFTPGGGRLSAALRYSNSIDYFESADFKYASSMGNFGSVDVSWRWLPKTAIYAQVMQGIITYLNDDQPTTDPNARKFTSYPLRAVAGLRGLVTGKLSVNLAAGYTAGFYQGSESPSGLSNLAAIAEFSYQPTPFSQLLFGYRHEFRNSIIGNYFDVDTPYLRLNQKIVDRIVLSLYGKYEHRRYQGLVQNGMEVDRTDHFVYGGGHVDYFIQQWVSLGAGYLTYINRSKVPAGVGGLDYTKHQVFGRLAFVY